MLSAETAAGGSIGKEEKAIHLVAILEVHSRHRMPTTMEDLKALVA